MSHFKKMGLVLAILALAGCAKQATVRPGAVNTFDSQAFDSLVTAQAAIEQASKEITAFPNLKPELNHVIDGYNSAMVAYKAYHEAALAGKPTDQASLAKLIQGLTSAVASIIAKLHPPATVAPVAFLQWRMA